MQNAFVCIDVLKADGYCPATIFDIGTSNGKELGRFRAAFPDAMFVCAEPRDCLAADEWRRMFRGVVGDGHNAYEDYCTKCRSLVCTDRRHVHRNVPATTLDALAVNAEPPYFLWIDVEGWEIRALNGAAKVLPATRWINIEVQDVANTVGHATAVHDWLVGHGYDLHLIHTNRIDRLYRRREM